MTTKMPFPVLPEKLCENPECDLGEGKKPLKFRPVTPWQRTCCVPCRNRLNYIEVRGPKLRAELEARGGPKPSGRPRKALPPKSHQGESEKSSGEPPF